MERDINKYTKNYLKDEFEKYNVFFRRKKVLDILNKYKPQTILECGCGMESIFKYYNNYKNAYIVEPSEEFCNINKNSEFYNNKIVIINDYAENTYEKLKYIKFDFIIISSLIHELVNPNILLNVISKLANKDTIIHINVPNNRSFHLLWAKEAGLIKDNTELSETAKIYQRNHTFNLDTLKDYCKTVNLAVIEEGSYFFKIFNNLKMLTCIKENLITEDLLNALDSLTKYFPDNGAEIFVNCKRRYND